MNYVFQIFTGDLTERSLADHRQIIDKLAMAHEAGKLAGVLCGWTKDENFYLKIGNSCINGAYRYI